MHCCRGAHPIQTARRHFFKPMLKFLVFFHSSESWWMAEAQQKGSKGCLGLLPRQQQSSRLPLHTAQEERHRCLDNWNTFKGAIFHRASSQAVSYNHCFITQDTIHRPAASPPAQIPTTPLLYGHTPTHHTPEELLHTQDTSSTASTNSYNQHHQGNISHQFSPNLSPPAEYLPPVQPQSPSALGSSPALPHRLHVLPCWTASTF